VPEPTVRRVDPETGIVTTLFRYLTYETSSSNEPSRLPGAGAADGAPDEEELRDVKTPADLPA
jgi:hypothetical protein